MAAPHRSTSPESVASLALAFARRWPVALALVALTGCQAPGMSRFDAPVPMAVQARMVLQAAGDDSPSWNLAQIHRSGFTIQSQSSHTVVVAVLDTGVDPKQPALQGHLYPLIDVVGNDVYTYGTRRISYAGVDGNGHGTHVSGIVSSVVMLAPLVMLVVLAQWAIRRGARL